METTKNVRATVLVHGGAGTHALLKLDVNAKDIVQRGVVAAARSGYKALHDFTSAAASQDGTTSTTTTTTTAALQAVVAAVASMEDNNMFNAGCGSCLTSLGTIEMDASLQSGVPGLPAGAVVGIEGVKNPVKVAKAVMDKTAHIALVGGQAKKFAADNGLVMASNESLTTDRSKLRLANCSEFKPGMMHYKIDKDGQPMTTEAIVKQDSIDSSKYGTVGAVAVDSLGNVAYATSTGGINAKMPGRMGDTPIIGSGGYADNNTCAVSTTGDGEAIAKACMAFYISNLVENGQSLDAALEAGLERMNSRTLGGMGGCIAVDPKGHVAVQFNTAGMSWARVTASDDVTTTAAASVHYGIYKSDDFVEEY